MRRRTLQRDTDLSRPNYYEEDCLRSQGGNRVGDTKGKCCWATSIVVRPIPSGGGTVDNQLRGKRGGAHIQLHGRAQCHIILRSANQVQQQQWIPHVCEHVICRNCSLYGRLTKGGIVNIQHVATQGNIFVAGRRRINQLTTTKDLYHQVVAPRPRIGKQASSTSTKYILLFVMFHNTTDTTQCSIGSSLFRRRNHCTGILLRVISLT